MASRAKGGKSSSTKLLTTKLLGDDSKKLSSAAQDREPEEATECSSPLERRGEEADDASSLGTEGSGERQLFPSNTSVQSVLRNISRGSTIAATPWKLTRAVVHLEDAWKGRVSPCPPLEKREPATRHLFKLRWKYRSLEFAVVHLLLRESCSRRHDLIPSQLTVKVVDVLYACVFMYLWYAPPFVVPRSAPSWFVAPFTHTDACLGSC